MLKPLGGACLLQEHQLELARGFETPRSIMSISHHEHQLELARALRADAPEHHEHQMARALRPDAPEHHEHRKPRSIMSISWSVFGFEIRILQAKYVARCVLDCLREFRGLRLSLSPEPAL